MIISRKIFTSRKITTRLVGASALALVAAWANPALAACSNIAPVTGETLICDESSPNPDNRGIHRGTLTASLPDRVTVRVINDPNVAGAGGVSSIHLGRDAIITTDAGTTVAANNSRGDGAAIDIESGSIDIAGSVTSTGPVGLGTGIDVGNTTLSPSGSTVLIRETGSVTASGGTAAIIFQGYTGGLTTIDGTVNATGTWHLFATDPIGRPNQRGAAVYLLGDGARIIVGRTGAVTSDGQRLSAVWGRGPNAVIDIAGNVTARGLDAAAVRVGGDDLISAGSTRIAGGLVTIRPTAIVSATATQGVGVELAGAGAALVVEGGGRVTSDLYIGVTLLRGGSVTNAGRVESLAFAAGTAAIMAVSGGTTHVGTTITNSGEIVSAGLAIGVGSGNIDTVTVRNAGRIASASGQAFVGGGEVDMVDNSGRIEGSIALGAGSDALSNRAGGVVTGRVDMGAADDMLDNVGRLQGGVLLGTGNDILTTSAGSFVGGAAGGFNGAAILAGDGNDSIDISGQIDGGIELGDGDDVLIVGEGARLDGTTGLQSTILGGMGNDRLTFAANTIRGAINVGDDDNTSVDIVTFLGPQNLFLLTGSGNDQLVFAGSSDYTFNYTGTQVANFDLVTKDGGATVTLVGASTLTGLRYRINNGTLRGFFGLDPIPFDIAGGTLEARGAIGATTVANGAMLSSGDGPGVVGTLSVASLALSPTSHLRFELGAPGQIGGADNDLINVTGNLTLDGLLDVNARPNFGNGVYRLINYGGTLTNNGLVTGTVPTGTYQVQTAVGGQVNLVVSGIASSVPSIQFWDGTGTVADGAIGSGAGTWNTTATNWTRSNGGNNDPWGGNFAVFQGNGGTVTIDPAGVGATGLQFAGNGYRIEGGMLTLTAPGTLRVGDGTAAGAAFTTTIASVIAGSGGIEKTDLGTLILSGTNTYTGGTRVLSGVLTVANDANLGAAAGGVTLDGGTLRASGALTSARGFILGTSGGTLDLGASGATLSGVLAGSGALTVTGSSLLTLSGNSAARTGATRIASGTLAISGSLGGPLTIASGASLTGTGTTGNLIVEGRVAPGNSPGTLTVNGNLVFAAGSTYAVELGAAGATDRINATGTATLNGGTVAITTLDPDVSYTNGSVYRILNAAGGRTGTFAALTENSAFLDFALAYDATGVNVNVAVVRTFPAVAQTFNQTNAATGLRDLGQVAGSDPLIAYQAILLLDSAPARAAFDAASGEIYPTLMAAALRRGALASDRLASRAFAAVGAGWGLWGGASGHDGRVNSDGNGARFTYSGIGSELGVDYRGIDNRWALGISGGVFSADSDLPGRASRAKGDGWHVGGYARVGDGHAGVSAVMTGDYARSTADVSRSIAFGTLTRTATAKPRVFSHTFSLEARYGFGSGDWAFGPVAGIEYAKVRIGRFTESGASSLNLTGGDNRDEATRWIGGLFANFQGTHGTIDLSLRYARGDRLSEAGLTLAGSPTAFRVRSAAGSEDAVQARISGDYSLGGGWSLGGDVRGTLASDERAIAGSATLSYRF